MQIKEGAENLRKVAKDKKSVSDVNHIVKKSINKLSELQAELQELDSQLLVTQGNLPTSPLVGKYQLIQINTNHCKKCTFIIIISMMKLLYKHFIIFCSKSFYVMKWNSCFLYLQWPCFRCNIISGSTRCSQHSW